MIEVGHFKNRQIADVAHSSTNAVKAIRRNLRDFGSTRAPAHQEVVVGALHPLNPVMREALLEHLLGKPGLSLEEMEIYLWDEFEASATNSSINRTLRSAKWSKKKARAIARGRSADLRDFYLHSVSLLRSYQLVYVDESGCDKRIGFRRTGWSPLGVTPQQITQFHRGERYQILPAYSQDGILLSRVFRGTNDTAIFEDFIKQLLHHCG